MLEVYFYNETWLASQSKRPSDCVLLNRICIIRQCNRTLFSYIFSASSGENVFVTDSEIEVAIRCLEENWTS